jgi:hypothetical protein
MESPCDERAAYKATASQMRSQLRGAANSAQNTHFALRPRVSGSGLMRTEHLDQQAEHTNGDRHADDNQHQ